jgi:hypothetical protein
MGDNADAVMAIIEAASQYAGTSHPHPTLLQLFTQ